MSFASNFFFDVMSAFLFVVWTYIQAVNYAFSVCPAIDIDAGFNTKISQLQKNWMITKIHKNMQFLSQYFQNNLCIIIFVIFVLLIAVLVDSIQTTHNINIKIHLIIVCIILSMNMTIKFTAYCRSNHIFQFKIIFYLILCKTKDILSCRPNNIAGAAMASC